MSNRELLEQYRIVYESFTLEQLHPKILEQEKNLYRAESDFKGSIKYSLVINGIYIFMVISRMLEGRTLDLSSSVFTILAFLIAILLSLYNIHIHNEELKYTKEHYEMMIFIRNVKLLDKVLEKEQKTRENKSNV